MLLYYNTNFRMKLFFPNLVTNLNTLTTNTLQLVNPLVTSIQLRSSNLSLYSNFFLQNRLTRFRKAPYADSYWFLYSAKLTYYTDRTL